MRHVGRERTPLTDAFPVRDQRWRSLLACTSDFVVVVDGEGRILYAEGMSPGLAGTSEGIVGRNIADLVAPECRDPVRDSIGRVCETGQRVRQMVSFSGAGHSFRREVRLGPIPEGRRTVAVGMFFSAILQREQMEARQRETEMALGSIVKAVPKMMDIMDGVIRQGVGAAEPRLKAQVLDWYHEQMIRMGRLVAVGKATSNLADRLPQFLTAITVSVENALAKLEKVPYPVGVMQELQAALRVVSTVATSAEQVRQFGETAAKRNLVHRVELGPIVARVVELLEAQARLANTVVFVEDLDPLPAVRMAEGDTEQLLFSLVESLIASVDGTDRHRIAVAGVVKDRHVALRFSGDGCAIRPEELNRAQAWPVTAKPTYQAGGPGVCLAKAIVAQAGGAIWSEDAVGVGPAVIVTLPIAD